MTPEVKEQMKELPPEVRKDVEKLVKDFRTGKLDPRDVGVPLSRKEIQELLEEHGL